MPYAVMFLPRALRQLGRLPYEWQDLIWRRTEALADEPVPPETHEIGRGQGMYRLEVRPFDVLYRVHGDLNLIRIRRLQYRPIIR